MGYWAFQGVNVEMRRRSEAGTVTTGGTREKLRAVRRSRAGWWTAVVIYLRSRKKKKKEKENYPEAETDNMLKNPPSKPPSHNILVLHPTNLKRKRDSSATTKMIIKLCEV